MIIQRRALSFFVIVLIIGLLTMPRSPVVASTQTDIVGPAGSEAFGTQVIVLSNGNFVVTDPYYDDGTTVNVGAVYLYDGRSGERISMLTGSTAGDQVGSWGVTALTNGNYVVSSPSWDNAGVVDVGAVTWGDGTSGMTGVVSGANSLVGSSANDGVGWVTALTNGNYVVHSNYWDNGGVGNAGAVTWGDGTTGVAGVISAANSLVGSSTDDGIGGVIALMNGNYVVRSPWWDNGVVKDAGAVTWGDGTTGVTGEISAVNSLVGSNANDGVGWVMALRNGNYVVHSPFWDNGVVVDAGAATWGDGTAGVAGEVSATNSLVGSNAYDLLGSSPDAWVGQVTELLTNGNYVVVSPYWDNGGATDGGAVTWGDGTSGVTGEVSAANSLVGSTTEDLVGNGDVTELANGNYVVVSPNWHNGGATDAGAVTWGDGTSGVTGTVSAANSLVGGTVGDDQVGYYGRVIALNNGNYIVCSPFADIGGLWDAGAVTWGDGTSGVWGEVSPANSLVGSSASDRVGWGMALRNGNYVVISSGWDNGIVKDAGAVTWGDGTSGVRGEVSAANSLVGSTTEDLVGNGDVTELANGSYAVVSPNWHNGGVTDAGAVTWGNGTTGVVGAVSAANSLVGSSAGDGIGGVTALTNGNYVVYSALWDNGGVTDAGAVTWGNGTTGVVGAVSAANSLVGSTPEDLVGNGNVTALTNGNYVVYSALWDNGVVKDAGAVTWGDGTTGVVGAVSAANSLVGSAYDVMALANGDYVVRSPEWDNGVVKDAGAVTWGNGANETTGVVSAANSLVGGSTYDYIGSDVITLDNGSYVVSSPWWDNAGVVDAGAISWGDGNYPATGLITAENSVRGTTASGGPSLNFAFDEVNQQLVVNRLADNIVTLFRLNLPPVDRPYSVHLPVILNQASP